MRWLWLAVGFLMTSVGVTAGSECDRPEADRAAAKVRLLNAQYIDAVRAGDADWFRRHMTEEAVIILGSGQRLGRPEFLELVDGPSTFRSLTVRDVTVRVFGPTVQVHADAPWERLDGQRGVSRYIDTYVWRDGRWQVISAQITLLPEA